jgi:cell division protein FtsQ
VVSNKPARIDPRVRARRTEVARAAGRRRLRILVRALVVVAVGAGAVALVRSPLLDVDAVRVEGAASTAEAAVAEVAGLTGSRTPMLTLDRRTLARRIETLPWVASASVHRDWPSTVLVRIVERVPVATIPVPNGVALVDADGRVLGTASTAPPGLVVINVVPRVRVPGTQVELTVQHALAVVVALPVRLADQVRGVSVSGEPSAVALALDLSSGVTVSLGSPGGVEEKLRAALAVLDAEKPPAGSVLDVRVPRSPTLKPPG